MRTSALHPSIHHIHPLANPRKIKPKVLNQKNNIPKKPIRKIDTNRQFKLHDGNTVQSKEQTVHTTTQQTANRAPSMARNKKKNNKPASNEQRAKHGNMMDRQTKIAHTHVYIRIASNLSKSIHPSIHLSPPPSQIQDNRNIQPPKLPHNMG